MSGVKKVDERNLTPKATEGDVKLEQSIVKKSTLETRVGPVDDNLRFHRQMQQIEEIMWSYHFLLRNMIREDRNASLDSTQALPKLAKKVKDTHEHSILYNIGFVALPIIISAASIGCSLSPAQKWKDAATPMSMFSQAATQGSKTWDESTQGDRQQANFELDTEKKRREDADARKRDQDGILQQLNQQSQAINDRSHQGARDVLS